MRRIFPKLFIDTEVSFQDDCGNWRKGKIYNRIRTNEGEDSYVILTGEKFTPYYVKESKVFPRNQKLKFHNPDEDNEK